MQECVLKKKHECASPQHYSLCLLWVSVGTGSNLTKMAPSTRFY